MNESTIYIIYDQLHKVVCYATTDPEAAIKRRKAMNDKVEYRRYSIQKFVDFTTTEWYQSNGI